MNLISIFDKVIAIILITSIVFLNIYLYGETYVGDFAKYRTIYYPPPFKTHTKIYVYNIVENEIDTTEYIGLILGLSKSIDENEIITIKSYGLDIYTLIISIIVIFIYYKLVRHYIVRVKTYVLNTTLLLIVIITMYIYAYLINIPVIYGNINELVETIDCKSAPGLPLNICLIDSFNTYSIIYFKVNNDVLIQFFRNNNVIHRELISRNSDFLKTIDTNVEYRLVILSPASSINITYRRVSFINTRDYLLTIIVSYLPISVIIAILVINKLFRIKNSFQK